MTSPASILRSRQVAAVPERCCLPASWPQFFLVAFFLLFAVPVWAQPIVNLFVGGGPGSVAECLAWLAASTAPGHQLR